MRHPTEGAEANGNCGESFRKEDGDACSTSEPGGASNPQSASTSTGSSNDTTETQTPLTGASSLSSGATPGLPAHDARTGEASDVPEDTKASLMEEKDPAANVMEGLMRRWDFNFFKNN